MKKLALFVVTLLFCLGTVFSTTASVQGGRDCVRRCREEARQARERCRNLQGEARRRCLHEVNQHQAACIRGCQR